MKRATVNIEGRSPFEVGLVLWDLDETLWSRAGQTRRNGLLLSRLFDIPHEQLEMFWHGRTIASVLEHFLTPGQLSRARSCTLNGQEVTLPSGQTADQIAAWYSEHFEARIGDDISISLLPGAEARIDELATLAVPTAVVTSASLSTVEAVRKHTGLRFPESTLFVTADRLSGDPGKPHPHPVWMTLKSFSIEPTDAVFVGDSLSDVLCGWLAGTHVINVGTGPHDLTSRLTHNQLSMEAERRDLSAFVPAEVEGRKLIHVQTLELVSFAAAPPSVEREA